jgi:hypothetical protein
VPCSNYSSDFYTGMSCLTATVTCPNTDNIGVVHSP